MENLTAYLNGMLIIGITATLLMDVWGVLRQALLGIAAPDYGLVGRWILHMRHGQFRHPAIAKAPAQPGEKRVGWLAHYLIGLSYAALLLAVVGLPWVSQPTLAPALLIGIVTVAAPFLLMQPGMGAGIAASRTPAPNQARLQSLLMHSIFGLGLYLGGWTARGLLF